VAADVQGVVNVQVDLTGFDLPVVLANTQELGAHDDVLGQIDKSSGGKTLWKKQVENAI
jgi:DNA polymerase-3 subunit epsilon